MAALPSNLTLTPTLTLTPNPYPNPNPNPNPNSPIPQAALPGLESFLLDTLRLRQLGPRDGLVALRALAEEEATANPNPNPNPNP